MGVVLLSLFAFGVVCWLLMLIRGAYHGSSIEDLADQSRAENAPTPRLSIIFAARNEAQTIRQSLTTLLQVDYPNVEFVLVNDRSTDTTGDIMDEIAAEDQRVRIIHDIELPKGWLGKVNALRIAEKLATGKWLLFTDADIHFGPHVLTRAIANAERKGLDHFMLIPDSIRKPGDFMLQLLNACFGIFFVQAIRAKYLSTPNKKSFGGVGAFNLVRRETFDKTPGFDALKMEVLDDVGVGYLIKQYGGKSELMNGRGLLLFEWYPTVRDMVHGLEKNSFAGFAHFSFLRSALILLMLGFVLIGPLVIAVMISSWLFIGIYLAFYFLLPAIVGIFLYRKVKVDPTLMLSLPLGFAILWFTLLRSTFAAWRHKGIYWRGTFYPLDILQKSQVVKL